MQRSLEQMGIEIGGAYEGALKVTITHGPSGAELRTAAPVDNAGDGSSFSPTDLLAASLGACMLTVMAIRAEREGWPMEGARFRLEKRMRAMPRRVDEIPVTLELPAALEPGQRAALEATALACPVHLSLLPEIRREVRFVYR
jgi:putative redox protein